MDTLLLFVKAPRPGQVKTRLAAVLGDELAVALYRALVEAVLGATEGGAQRMVLVAPAEALRDVQAWLPGETCLPQQGEGLGARMARAFETAFARGARRVAVAGSDVPGLDAAVLRHAFDALEDAEVAIAPAGDGGYSLLALRAPQPHLLAEMEWSTPKVLEETLRRAAGLRVTLLPELPDLDTVDDLRRAWPGLRERLDPGLCRAIERRTEATEAQSAQRTHRDDD
jgi:rSAM/selenodomain-associated transferase 1